MFESVAAAAKASGRGVTACRRRGGAVDVASRCYQALSRTVLNDNTYRDNSASAWAAGGMNK